MKLCIDLMKTELRTLGTTDSSRICYKKFEYFSSEFACRILSEYVPNRNALCGYQMSGTKGYENTIKRRSTIMTHQLKSLRSSYVL
jgi:hypothetical protein